MQKPQISEHVAIHKCISIIKRFSYRVIVTQVIYCDIYISNGLCSLYSSIQLFSRVNDRNHKKMISCSIIREIKHIIRIMKHSSSGLLLVVYYQSTQQPLDEGGIIAYYSHTL